MKIKVITGYREDQQYTLDAEETHKAYYLFLHPDQRAVFSNGVALIGKNIQGIEPDYQATMGWNPSHVLDGDDWNEIRSKGVDIEARRALEDAKSIAYMDNPQVLTLSLSGAKERYLLGTRDQAKLVVDENV